MSEPTIVTFHAQHPGRCDACGNHITYGQRIAYHPDYRKPLCVRCLTDGPAVDRSAPIELSARESVCPHCNLVHAGECG